MKILLTEKSGGELVVDTDHIKFFEPAIDKETSEVIGSHIVFGSDLGRIVRESTAAIASVMGVVSVPQKQGLVASVAKVKKK